MKKILLLSVLLMYYLLPSQGQNVIPVYTFEVESGMYNEFSDGVPILENELWKNPLEEVDLGFNFTLMGKTFNKLWISGNFIYFDTLNLDYIIGCYDISLEDRGFHASGIAISPLTYKIEGSAGNKVFKYQIKNAGFFYGTFAEYANIQIWLYEGSNNIEMHYGDQFVQSDIWDDQLGISAVIAALELSAAYYVSVGDYAPELVLITDDTTEVDKYVGIPADGRIYRFKPQTVGTQDIDGLSLTIFPNPSAQYLKVQLPPDITGDTYSITNIAGVMIQNNKINSDGIIELGHWPAGLYTLELTTNKGNISRQFIKK